MVGLGTGKAAGLGLSRSGLMAFRVLKAAKQLQQASLLGILLQTVASWKALQSQHEWILPLANVHFMRYTIIQSRCKLLLPEFSGGQLPGGYPYIRLI